LGFPIVVAADVLIDYEKYPLSAFNTILATRGCPRNCLFCGSRTVFGRKPRFRSVKNIVNEIICLQKKGLKRFEFVDDFFGVNTAFLNELCGSLAKNCPGISWECETRVDLITEGNVKAMKASGCSQIHVGVESGNDEILCQMRKGIKIEQAISAIKIIKKQGVALRANFLLGFPGETEKTLNDTLSAMKRLDCRLGFSIFTPYPGSEAFDYCKRAGLIGEDYDASLYNHQSPENCFCTGIGKQRFREITREIERYVDKRNNAKDFNQIFSKNSVNILLSSGAFRDVKSLRQFSKRVFVELKQILISLVSQEA
jgi:anaerobic magnesium-protoporphyrin IX monomethyl ester cyclase